MKSYLQVYTGTGKGKTTAALGLALRAVGAGHRVFIGQFIKKGDCSEICVFKKLSDNVTIMQYGRGRFIRSNPSDADIRAARRGLNELRDAMLSGEYDLVIADELNPAVSCGLIDVDALLCFVADRPANIELVITGRDAHPRLKKLADLITDMRCVKHYYTAGVRARKGIEV